MLPFLMQTLELQKNQEELAIDARIEKLRHLRDDMTLVEVKHFFIKLDALVKKKNEKEKMDCLDLKVSGRAQFIYQSAREDRQGY